MAIPGVKEQQSTFGQILEVTLAIAVVVIEARSEPIPGSVIATAVIRLPAAIPGSHRCFCSSVQYFRK